MWGVHGLVGKGMYNGGRWGRGGHATRTERKY